MKLPHLSNFTKKRPQGGSAGQDDLGGQQPFALVKYFSFTSLAVILIASLVLTWSFSRNARETMLERSEIYSRMFAESLNRQVFYLFVLPTFVRYGRIALSDPVQYSQLDLIITDITRGMNIKSVTIFDSKENRISYSTDSSLKGKAGAGGIEYQKALGGESSTVLFSSGSMLNLMLPGGQPVSCLLQTYVPFRQGGQGEIMGVVAVTQDLSADLEALISLQFKIIIVSLAVMGILFAVLSAIVLRADRIMEARAEERRELEKQLHESKRLATLGKMIASVSHEIKNPLGIVRSTAEIIAKRIGKVAPGNEHLAAIIVQETTRLDGIVREFLDFARPKEPNLAPASLNSLAERMAVFMEAEFTAKQIQPVLELDTALPELMIDSEQMYQALLNIVFNAVHAMTEKGRGTLTVRTRLLSGGGAALEVEDTGCGMSEEKLSHIFTPFYTDKNRGTGLGLSITKNIIEKHGGTISVKSREGEGTTFAVSLMGAA
ncbi:two-component system sensor histidine kinase NtrB [Candidatus Electronema sp. TJ]|uniref:two-component system sensor histidine kinase NtrB n=1 Tax=Candidatus Electronema sp. TJ TaxID=3401573 RepID=UPI003AA8B8BA